MCSRSLDEVFLVFVHISLKDVFHWAQESLEGITVDRDNSAACLRFDTGLTNGVLHQGNFSEIVAFLVFKHLLGLSSSFFLFCNEFSFSNDVESGSLLSLPDNIASCFEFFLLERVTELFLLIRVDFSQDFNFGKD